MPGVLEVAKGPLFGVVRKGHDADAITSRREPGRRAGGLGVPARARVRDAGLIQNVDHLEKPFQSEIGRVIVGEACEVDARGAA